MKDVGFSVRSNVSMREIYLSGKMGTHRLAATNAHFNLDADEKFVTPGF